MPPYVYLNGELVAADQAKISVFDAGLLHGASSFTTMLARNGKVFRLDRHIERLLGTVELLGLRIDQTPASLGDAVARLLAACELRDARMRITLTPGPIGGDRAGSAQSLGQPTTLISADPLPAYPKEWYEKGITAVVSSFKQVAGDVTFGFKTGCYMPRILARQEAAAKGAQEALWFTTTNRLAEACFNNVFLVLAGKVYTPPKDTPVLPGVAREATLELCEKVGIAATEESELTVKEMLGAQEVFLTGSTTGIRPVVRIERHAVSDERPGPVTRKLMDAYARLLDEECPAE